MIENHEHELAGLQEELRDAREQLKLLAKAEIRSQSSQIERDRQFARIRALSELALREGALDDTRGILEAAKHLLLTTFDLEGVVSANVAGSEQEGELHTRINEVSNAPVVIPRALASWFATIPTAAVINTKEGSIPHEFGTFLEQHGVNLQLVWVVVIALRRRPSALVVVLVAWKTEQGRRSYHRLPPTEHDLPFLQLLGRHLERALENATLVTDLRHRGTELAEANQRLMTSLENLDETHRRLHEAQKMEALGRLAGGVAHDFNNLLCVILGNAGLMAESMPPSTHLDGVRQIMDAAERGREISSQLLALGRRHPEGVHALELNEVLRAQIRFLSRLVGELHPLELELAAEPFWIQGEKALVERTVMNLVLNARDAMPSGGCIRIGTRKASPAELTPPYDDVVAEGWVALTVADTGLGMDEATRQHIFEPFFTTKEKGQGTGLGLSVVYGTVSRYGGQIHVESAKAQGTRFILLLPTTSPEYAPKPTPELEAHPPMSSVRVLVVEDDTIIRGIVARVLTSRGYDVIVAANGEDALELVQSRSHPPHLLLTDVVMPGISGPKLAAKLRVHWPRLRVLYMSGYTFAEMDEDTAPDPTEAFVSKPFSPQELCSHVEQLLRS